VQLEEEKTEIDIRPLGVAKQHDELQDDSND